MDKIRLGFVGCGPMGQLVHLPILAELKQCKVVALAEIRPELRERVAERFDIPKLYGSHEELAEDPKIDAVVAITGDDLHAPIAIDLLNAGKHVFIEKPLATNVADGEAMVSAAESGNLVLMVDFMRRYDPGVELALRILERLRRSGDLGDIVSVQTRRFGNAWFSDIGEPITTDEPYPEVARTSPSWLPPDLVGKFRHINGVYSHNVDMLRYLLGEPLGIDFAHIATNLAIEADLSFASGRTSTPWVRGPRSEGEAQFITVMRFDDFCASIVCGSSSGRFWDEETMIYFNDGWIRIRTPATLLQGAAAQIEVCTPGDQRESPSPSPASPWCFRRAQEHFLDCIVRGKQPRTSGADALKSLEVMEAIFARHLETNQGRNR